MKSISLLKGFLIGVVAASPCSALMTLAAEVSPPYKIWLSSLTGNYWVSHGVVVVAVFFALSLAVAMLWRGGRGEENKDVWKLSIAAVLSATLSSVFIAVLFAVLALSPRYAWAAIYSLTVAAGIAVLITAISWILSRRGRTARGFVQALAGGLLGFQAMEMGSEVSEFILVEITYDLFFFLILAVTTLITFTAIYISFTVGERRVKSGLERMTSYTFITAVTAVALWWFQLGIDIAELLYPETTSLAFNTVYISVLVLYTAASSAILVAPLAEKSAPAKKEILASILISATLLASILLVYSVYSTPSEKYSPFILLRMNMAVAGVAASVYTMLHVNLAAMGKLGGFTSTRFWLALVTGVAISITLESIDRIVSILPI